MNLPGIRDALRHSIDLALKQDTFTPFYKGVKLSGEVLLRSSEPLASFGCDSIRIRLNAPHYHPLTHCIIQLTLVATFIIFPSTHFHPHHTLKGNVEGRANALSSSDNIGWKARKCCIESDRR